MDLSKINLKQFYEKYLKLTHLTGDEYRALCPFHKDTSTPNLSVNVVKGVYKCFACDAAGNIVDFYKKHTGKTAREFAIENNITSIGIDKVDEYANALQADKEKLYFLKTKRGYTEETIKKSKIGWDGYRYTYPIPDRYGVVINLRRYDPNAKKYERMISYKKGYGKSALLGIRDLIDNKKCIICAGEHDRTLLKQNGFNVCCSTTGEYTWLTEWSKICLDKELTIIFDCDVPGRSASTKVASLLFDNNKIKVIDLNLAEGEDITDWYIKYKRTTADLQALIDATKLYVKQDIQYIETKLSSASNSEYYNKNIMFKSLVAGKRLSPFQVPKSIELQCDAKKTRKCAACALGRDGYAKVEMNNREAILEMIDINNFQLMGIVKRELAIPKCDGHYIVEKKVRNIEELYLIPEVTFMDFEDTGDYVTRRGYFLGDKLETNRTYTFYGTTLPDPKNQQVVHLLEKAVPSTDNIDEFKLTDDTKKQLEKFKQGDKTIQEKLDEIYKDLTYNVTRIYKREDLLFAYDLVYHSVLGFKFLNESDQRGWLELFVLGDAGQGKSQTIQKLIKHYKAGERISGENASRTGLTYAIQDMGKGKSTLRWGKIPLNDKRIVIVDQAEQLSPEDYSNLTDMRSSGIIKVARYHFATTYARTRMVMIANPKRRLIEYNYGVIGLKEIVGLAQNIRRFDFVITTSDIDVPVSEMNRKHTEKVEHIFDSDSCHNSIMFSWSRKVGDIKFTESAEKRVLEVAQEFSGIFSSTIPIVLGAEIRMKIARFSVALACLLYNVDKSGEKVTVTRDHVDYIRLFLLKLFSKPGLDYYAYSVARKKEGKLVDEKYVVELINGDVPLIDLLLDNVRFGKGELKDILETNDAVVNKLFKMRVFKKLGSSMIKTNAFTNFLKRHKKELESKGEEEIV